MRRFGEEWLLGYGRHLRARRYGGQGGVQESRTLPATGV